MKIFEATDSDKVAYNEFVSSHPSGTFLQSWDWGEWQTSLGKPAKRLLIAKESKIIFAAQLLLIQTSLGPYAYSAYGPLAQTSLSDEETQRCLKLFEQAAQSLWQNLLFLRVEPAQNLKAQPHWRPADHIQPPNMLALDLDSSESELLAGMHSKTRYNIKLAQKNNLQVKTDEDVSRAAIELIMMTVKKQKYRGQSREYIEKLCKFFEKPNSSIGVSSHVVSSQSGTNLASAIMLDFAQTRTYLFGGSNYEYRNLMGSFLLQWNSILEAKNKGLLHYDFGSAETASGKEKGFAHFKKGFGAQLVNFGGTYDIVFKPSWHLVYTLLRKLNRTLKQIKLKI